MASQKPASPAMDFLVDSLKRNPKAAYSDLKAKADEKNLKLFPIMFGRAQLLLGIVKSGDGQGKAAKARAAKTSAAPGARGRKADPSSKSGKIRALLATGMSAGAIAKKVGCTVGLVYNVKSTMGKSGGAPKRGPGRRPKAAASSVAGLDGLADIVNAVRSAERERAQLRGVLEQLQTVIADALA